MTRRLCSSAPRAWPGPPGSNKQAVQNLNIYIVPRKHLNCSSSWVVATNLSKYRQDSCLLAAGESLLRIVVWMCQWADLLHSQEEAEMTWDKTQFNTHPHSRGVSRQFRMPGLHIPLIPCLRWHLHSNGPHCFVLKNSGLFLLCTAPIQMSSIHLKKIVSWYFSTTARIGATCCSID